MKFQIRNVKCQIKKLKNCNSKSDNLGQEYKISDQQSEILNY